MPATTTNQRLKRLGRRVGAASSSPTRSHWCDGSAEEYDRLRQLLVDGGTFTPLDDDQAAQQLPGPLRPRRRGPGRGPHLHLLRAARSTPARPTTGATPAEMQAELIELYTGAMRGRTMYVVPFSMGPLGSPIAHIGVQLTDSRLRRRDHADHDPHGPGAPSTCSATTASSCRACTRSAHPLGRRRRPTCRGRATPTTSTSSTSPRPGRSGRYGSGYGGNALLGKKCFALRIASTMARDDGWLAEHMLILGSRRPSGEKRYVAAAFPSACGKTNMAMLHPDPARLEGRDRRRRHRLDEVRRRRPALRHQPRGRLLRRRPRHRRGHQPQRHATRSDGNSIFTNVALTDDGDVWWEGMTDEPPAHLIDWKGNDWTPESDDARPPTPTPASPPRPASARRSRPSGRTRRACRSRPSSSAAAAPPTCRWSPRPSTGSTACSSARSWPRRRRPRPPARSASCASTPSPCCRSAATTWATTSPTGCEIGAATDADKLPEALLGQLVPQGRRRQVPVAGLRREQPGAQVGRRAGGRRRPTPSTRRSAACPPPARIDTDGPRHRRRPTWPSSSRSTPRAGGPRSPRSRQHYASSASACPTSCATSSPSSRSASPRPAERRQRRRGRSRPQAARRR